ncbi:MAG: hypothetical protein LBU48_06405 [Coriobacteriales bacterium]|jgi:hypothetical protein|nr:hypothetical protein [Coriobacteriales bacterium]
MGEIEDGAENLSAEAAPDAQTKTPLTFEQKVDHVAHLLLANTLNRPTLYRILGITAQGAVPLFDLEDQIQKLPEFTTATQPPYYLIEWLVDAEALRFIEVDATGAPITDEQREGKTADEIDDLIDDMIIEITDVGREVAAIFDPRDRLATLLQDKPVRYDTYVEVLEFLTQKHSYNQIDSLLRGRPILFDGRDPGDPPMQPSVFVDKLAAAGAIVFDEGWIITPEGRALLQDAKKPERVNLCSTSLKDEQIGQEHE